ncbi:hypothetical protein [Nostoc sp.]|uniref:hypothetical protein n=1 Tax=Nostoc sp. TaxID=1180 RepID=UPI002FEFC9F8
MRYELRSNTPQARVWCCTLRANTTPVTLGTVANAQVGKPAHTTASPAYLFKNQTGFL